MLRVTTDVKYSMSEITDIVLFKQNIFFIIDFAQLNRDVLLLVKIKFIQTHQNTRKCNQIRRSLIENILKAYLINMVTISRQLKC